MKALLLMLVNLVRSIFIRRKPTPITVLYDESGMRIH